MSSMLMWSLLYLSSDGAKFPGSRDAMGYPLCLRSNLWPAQTREYGTHYMNLAYAPQKALSLMLAGEVFHSIPMYKNHGSYPGNTTFDGFKVNYEKDLAELVTDKSSFTQTQH